MTEQLQKALNAIDHAEAEPVVKATARGLMRAYDRRWGQSEWRIVSTEEEFNLPITNPDTGRTSRTFRHAGKFDGVFEFHDKFFLCEHKVCSEDIAADAPYWKRLEIDSQVSGYVLANWEMGLKLDGTCYDVIRRPAIRPKQLTKNERQYISFTGSYCGSPISEQDRAGILSIERETPELFEARVCHDAIENSAWYFARRTIARMDDQLLDYARELWQTADEIRQARAQKRFYRNTGACMQWNRPCVYLGLCSGHDTPQSDKWTTKKSVHTELPELEGDGRNVLTQSSMGTFKTCKRKFHYRYDLGLERLEKEDAESLFFGTLLHQALSAWWGALTPYQEESLCQ